MSRGLSELQKTILRLAHENRRQGRGKSGDTGTDVYYAEVLVAYFDFPPKEDRRDNYGPAVVGNKKYNRAKVSLHRAMWRLHDRGLVYCTRSMLAGAWSGAELSEEGEKVAGRLACDSLIG